MTPAQRKYDLDLAVSMHQMSVWIEPRSRKVSLTLKLAAERIEALVASIQIEAVVERMEARPPTGVLIQPASTPDQT